MNQCFLHDSFKTCDVISSSRALWLLWRPPSAGQMASCCSTPSHSASASWRSLHSRNSSTKPSRAWVGRELALNSILHINVTAWDVFWNHLQMSGIIWALPQSPFIENIISIAHNDSVFMCRFRLRDMNQCSDDQLLNYWPSSGISTGTECSLCLLFKSSESLL